MSISRVPLPVLASRLGLEAGELEPLGADRARVEPGAGSGDRRARWLVVSEALSAPLGPASGVAARLTEALERRGHVALATYGAPRLAEALRGQGLGGLFRSAVDGLTAFPGGASIREASRVLGAIRGSDGATSRRFQLELEDLVALSAHEQDLRRGLARLRVGPDGATLDGVGATASVLPLVRPALGPVLTTTAGEAPALVAAEGWDTAGLGATALALRSADWVITSARGRNLTGVRRVQDLVAPRVGMRPELVVLATDLHGLRWHSGALAKVRDVELERVLRADDPALAVTGLAALERRASQLERLGCKVALALEARAEAEHEELLRLSERLSTPARPAFVVGAQDDELAQTIDEAARPVRGARFYASDDLAAKASDAAHAGGALGSVAMTPALAGSVAAWQAAGFGRFDVLVEGPDASDWTFDYGALEHAAEVLRLRAGGASDQNWDRRSWTTLRFDAFGRVTE